MGKGDFKFSFRGTKIQPPVIGVESVIEPEKDLYVDQMHIGMIDFDDNLTLLQLKYLTKIIQEKFKEFVGDGYIYETSPDKYSLHFYNPALYFDWLKVIHFCNEYVDGAYCRWRMLRDSMVMRTSPKTEGYIPKLVAVIRTKYSKPELTWFKNSVFKMLKNEVNKNSSFPAECIRIRRGCDSKSKQTSLRSLCSKVI
jgi:hypothetical protein